MNAPPITQEPVEPARPPEREQDHWFWLDEEPHLHPTWPGTVAIVLSMVLGYVTLGGETSSQLARHAGLFLLAGLAISVVADLRVSLKNLIRVDLAAFAALYYLTFAEFVFAEQEAFNETVYSFDVRQAILAVYIGFLGLAVGRHLVKPGRGFPLEGDVGFPRNLFLLLLVGCFAVGNLYSWAAVSFNPADWFYHLSGARFSQPWARGKFGNWGTLMGEFKLFLQAVPALAGIIFARARSFAPWQLLLVLVILLVTLYQGFAVGTRYVLALNLAGFLGGYFIVQRTLRIRRILILGAAAGLLFIFLSHHQLQFRNMGLRTYWSTGIWKEEPIPKVLDLFRAEEELDPEESEFEGFFVDYNLRNIAGLVRAFPEQYDYLGWNMPFVAFTKPIPRALWKGKPEDFETGIEEALAADAGYTLSCTFVGESYMMWGLPGVLLMGLFFGAVFMFWNRIGSRGDSVFQRLVFATLFPPALISMRSVTAFTTYLLISAFLVVAGHFVLRHFSADPVTEEPED